MYGVQVTENCYAALFPKAKALHMKGDYAEARRVFAEAKNCHDKPMQNQLTFWDEKNERCLLIYNEGNNALMKGRKIEAESQDNTYAGRIKFTKEYRKAYKKFKTIKRLNPYHVNIKDLIVEAREKGGIDESRFGGAAFLILMGILVLLISFIAFVIRNIEFF